MPVYSYVITNGTVPLAVHLHRGTHDLLESQPAVIVMGSWLTVKEQMADGYAARLADRGYTAVTFDFAGFGASGGDLRQTEIPTRKIADIAAVVEFVSRLSMVAPGGPALVTVCASAQYAAAAIATGVPVRAFASIAGWFHDPPSLAAVYGGRSGVLDRLARADRAAAQYMSTGLLPTVPAYAPGDDRAGMFVELPYYADPHRGAVAEWRNEMTELTWQHWLTFDGLAAVAADRVTVPSVFVHSDDCVFPDNVRAITGRFTAAEIVWGTGTQIDFYDRPAQMTFAIDAVDALLRRTTAVSR